MQPISDVAVLDHLVVAARTLSEGEAYLQDLLGAALSGGGQHPIFGTHNRLLSLGGAYLEVIAIDPDAPAPTRLRWFGLDTPQVQAQLERGPALIHWVARTPAAPLASQGECLALSRGQYAWTLTVPKDGSLPLGGVLPSVITWHTDTPAAALPNVGVSLIRLELLTPQPKQLELALGQLQLTELATVHAAAVVGLRAILQTSNGEVVSV